MVRWCDGTMVRWCDGAMKRWCDGTMVRWCGDAMVWCIESLLRAQASAKVNRDDIYW